MTVEKSLGTRAAQPIRCPGPGPSCRTSTAMATSGIVTVGYPGPPARPLPHWSRQPPPTRSGGPYRASPWLGATCAAESRPCGNCPSPAAAAIPAHSILVSGLPPTTSARTTTLTVAGTDGTALRRSRRSAARIAHTGAVSLARASPCHSGIAGVGNHRASAAVLGTHHTPPP